MICIHNHANSGFAPEWSDEMRDARTENRFLPTLAHSSTRSREWVNSLMEIVARASRSEQTDKPTHTHTHTPRIRLTRVQYMHSVIVLHTYNTNINRGWCIVHGMCARQGVHAASEAHRSSDGYYKLLHAHTHAHAHAQAEWTTMANGRTNGHCDGPPRCSRIMSPSQSILFIQFGIFRPLTMH